MKSFQENMNEYKKQLEKGAIKEAYKGLMEYIMDLRTHFKNEYPDYFVSGSIYYGYMDMTRKEQEKAMTEGARKAAIALPQPMICTARMETISNRSV